MLLAIDKRIESDKQLVTRRLLSIRAFCHSPTASVTCMHVFWSKQLNCSLTFSARLMAVWKTLHTFITLTLILPYLKGRGHGMVTFCKKYPHVALESTKTRHFENSAPQSILRGLRPSMCHPYPHREIASAETARLISWNEIQLADVSNQN